MRVEAVEASRPRGFEAAAFRPGFLAKRLSPSPNPNMWGRDL